MLKYEIVTRSGDRDTIPSGSLSIARRLIRRLTDRARSDPLRHRTERLDPSLPRGCVLFTNGARLLARRGREWQGRGAGAEVAWRDDG